jgi:hypothetical protein
MLPSFIDEVDLNIDSTATDTDPATLFHGGRLDFLRTSPDGAAQLIVTSPPYNIGKAYEPKHHLDQYLQDQAETITEAFRVLVDAGSMCWQVGNHITGLQEIRSMQSQQSPNSDHCVSAAPGSPADKPTSRPA